MLSGEEVRGSSNEGGGRGTRRSDGTRTNGIN